MKDPREHMMLLPLVDLLDKASAPPMSRHGFTRGKVTSTNPLRIQLDQVAGTTDALIVGPTNPQIGDCLVVEDGSGRRYFLGNVRSV